MSKFLIPSAMADPALVTYSSSFKEVSEYFKLDKDELRDLAIMDFGCGYGRAVVEIATLGPRKVIGLDIRDSVLDQARQLAESHELRNCMFVNPLSDRTSIDELYGTIDIIVSIDAFEHYEDPAKILVEMDTYLAHDGRIYISFGPPWWHPYGCHLQFMTRLPWPHVFFTERVLMAARSLHKNDHAQKFEEVEGGLNRMSVKKFESLVRNSPFRIMNLALIPIRGTRIPHHYLPGGRELFTSVVKACLKRR